MRAQDTEDPNTTESSVAGDGAADGRKKRWEGNALRKSVLGKKHDRLGESKVSFPPFLVGQSFRGDDSSWHKMSTN